MKERIPVTQIQVPCDAPAMFNGIFGSAPVIRGDFVVRLSDGRLIGE